MRFIKNTILCLALLIEFSQNLFKAIRLEDNFKYSNSSKSTEFALRLMKKYSNWIDYENQLFDNRVDVIKKSEGDLTFVGENKIGRGTRISYQEKYKGQVKNTQMHGFGIISKKNQLTYVGEYENGLKNGIGCCIYNNGYRYKGYWKDDKKHGLGYFFIENLVIYGKWENDHIIDQKSITISCRNKGKTF
ncbi:hypothetical protein SteCoe_39805 [Stentor coeruleus]|uniref:MORN repeat protein n=1 Tax=Stentor coeruleus TaxID=5963 RepID=A0A1R2AKG3_9CILI|nr:hypothetical protein SteCoe_39805 [Stentor coeruleus]